MGFPCAIERTGVGRVLDGRNTWRQAVRWFTACGTRKQKRDVLLRRMIDQMYHTSSLGFLFLA